MAGYISEGIRYFRVASAHTELVDADLQNAFVSIVFSAMYMESVANEVIFHETLMAQQYKTVLGVKVQSIEMDIYNEMTSFIDKLHIILGHYGISGYENDNEFIEVSHLMTIRGFLVHLKPIEQIPTGEPERRICRAALNYLHNNLKIIDDPYGKGVFWTDVLMNRQVAEWAVATVSSGINWLHQKTHDGKLGNHTLTWHCQLTRQTR